jgi:hypothetical protein
MAQVTGVVGVKEQAMKLVDLVTNIKQRTVSDGEEKDTVLCAVTGTFGGREEFIVPAWFNRQTQMLYPFLPLAPRKLKLNWQGIADGENFPVTVQCSSNGKFEQVAGMKGVENFQDTLIVPYDTGFDNSTSSNGSLSVVFCWSGVVHGGNKIPFNKIAEKKREEFLKNFGYGEVWFGSNMVGPVTIEIAEESFKGTVATKERVTKFVPD